jgi:hypothetical protein
MNTQLNKISAGLRFHLTPKSANEKTGPIPVSTTSAATCPPDCPFNNSQGCYAGSGPLALHWAAVTRGDRGDLFADFCDKIAALPEGQLWRHNQAGDLPGNGLELDGAALGDLVKANKGRRGFTYTHYNPANGRNAAYIKGCNDHGFTVNLSANTPAHADKLAALGLGPVVTVLPIEQRENTVTPGGRKIVVCPATIREGVSCSSCQLCAISNREAIIGFPAHGTQAKKAARVFSIQSIH